MKSALVNTVQALSARGVGLRVLTAAGRFAFGIFAALAEFERERIRERTLSVSSLPNGLHLAWRGGRGCPVGRDPRG